ncbi:MAG: PAS domain S-box protein [Deltaproteobacteria bacterium]
MLESLNISPHQYSSLIDEMNVGLGIIDQEGVLKYVNRKMCEMCGYAKEEMEGQHIFHILDQTAREILTKELQKRKKGTTAPYPTAFIRKDGSKLETIVSPRPIFDRAGLFIGSFAVIIDVTEFNKTSEQLAITSIRYKQLFESMGDSVIMSRLADNGRDFVFTRANKAFCRNYGNREERDLIGRKLTEIGELFGKNGILQVIRRVWKSGNPEHCILSRSEGDTIATWKEFYTYKLPCGEVVTICSDRTKEKQTEEDLSRSVATLNTLFTASPIGIGVLVNRVLRRVNRQIAIMTGYGKEELIGSSSRLLYVDDTEFDRVGKEKLQQLKASGTAEVETQWLRKDGRVITILLRSTAFDSRDLDKGVIFTAQDITEAKAAKEQLEKSRLELETRVAARTIQLQEANIALRVLLQQSSEAKRAMEEKVLTNIKTLVIPYLQQLKKSELSSQKRMYLEVAEANLDQITSSFSSNLSATSLHLTSREIEIANLIRQGRTTKDIAEILNLSVRTIESYRDQLRKKLGLKSKKSNLKNYLIHKIPLS